MIRKGGDYVKFRIDVAELQEHKCAECGRYIFFHHEMEADDSVHLHHKNGRGMGGSKRDDTFAAVVALCGACHRTAHGQNVVSISSGWKNQWP